MSLSNDFWSAYFTYFDKMRERRIHRQTVAEISELPEHLRRDIGWPGAYERGRSRYY
jgi:Domain of unknown function (DUF1127)